MNEFVYRHIGWNLTQLRYKKQLTQEGLAKESGLSRQQIGRLEAGLGNIAVDSLIQLANFFDVSISKICEEPNKNFEVSFKLRRTSQEKDDTKFSKEYPESPKFKIINLKLKRHRFLRAQPDQVYDLLVINGGVVLCCDQFEEEILAGSCLSIKGVGTLRIRNSYKYPASQVLFIQTLIN